MNLSCTGSFAGGHWASRVRRRPCKKSLHVWDRAARDERYSSAIEYVYYQWTPQAVTDDVNDMQQQALGVIERAAEEDGHDA